MSEKTGGVYRGPVKEFERKLKKTFRKKEDLFVSSRIRKAMGTHPHQVKKYLQELERQGKLRKVTAYFLGCPRTDLIVVDFGFGEVAVCPTCGSDLPWPPEDGEVVCDCGVEYVQEEDVVWRYRQHIFPQGGGKWDVESYTKPKDFYEVDLVDRSCTCPHHVFRGAYCKHIKVVSRLAAARIFDKMSGPWKLKYSSTPAVFTAILSRWFDPRDHMRAVTVRGMKNDVKKINGIDLSPRHIWRVLRCLEKEGVVRATKNPEGGFGHTTFFTPDDKILTRCLLQGDSIWVGEDFTGMGLPDPSHEKEPFLAIDGVAHTPVAIPPVELSVDAVAASILGIPVPQTDINIHSGVGVDVHVHVNYRFPRPTAVSLVFHHEDGKKPLGIQKKRLSGEDTIVCSHELPPPDRKLWKVKVRAYYSKGREWIASDAFTTRRIHTCSMTYLGDGVFNVESFTEPNKFYIVDAVGETCECPHHQNHGVYCKHLEKVDQVFEKCRGAWMGGGTGPSRPVNEEDIPGLSYVETGIGEGSPPFELGRNMPRSPR